MRGENAWREYVENESVVHPIRGVGFRLLNGWDEFVDRTGCSRLFGYVVRGTLSGR